MTAELITLPTRERPPLSLGADDPMCRKHQAELIAAGYSLFAARGCYQVQRQGSAGAVLLAPRGTADEAWAEAASDYIGRLRAAFGV